MPENLDHLSSSELELYSINPDNLGRFIASYVEETHPADVDATMRNLLRVNSSQKRLLTLLTDLVSFSRTYRASAVKALRKILDTVYSTVGDDVKDYIKKNLVLVIQYETDDDIFSDLTMTVCSLLNHIILMPPPSVAWQSLFDFMVRINRSKLERFDKFLCNIIEVSPGFYRHMMVRLSTREDRNQCRDVMLNSVVWLLDSCHSNRLKMCAIRAIMGFLVFFQQITYQHEYLVVNVIRSIADVACNGGTEDQTELNNILVQMVESDDHFVIFSRKLIRISMVINHMFKIANLPTILEITRNSAIRLFIKVAAQASDSQASTSLVHQQSANLCVLLIKLMSQRTGEPDWDPEGCDDEEEDIEDENNDNVPTYVFANNQLSTLTSVTNSALIFQRVDRQAFQDTSSLSEVELYARILGMVHLIKGFLNETAFCAHVERMFWLGIRELSNSDNRLVWAAATLIWKISLKLKELSCSAYLLSQRDYVHSHLKPVASNHPSSRVRARVNLAISAL